MADIVLSVGGNVTELNNALDAALSRPRSVRGINAQSFTEPLGRITGKASEFQKSLEASNARVIAFGASAGAIFAVKSAFDTLVRATIDVEKSINSISTILGSSGSSLKAFSNDLFAVASQTGTSFKDASAAAQEFARQGLTASETILRTRDALILARISGMDFADAAKSITTAINAFASEALTSTDIINRLIAADTNFAVSAGDLAQALSRVGSSSEDANVSLNETISLVTSAAQITGRSGSVIGNAFKSIFTRLQRPQVLEDLEKIGILTRNAAGESLPLISVLRNLAGAYDSLAPGQKSFVAETVGGIYQINTLKAVLSDLGSGFSVYDSALKTVTNSTGSAIARNEQLNQTISSRLNETLNTLVKTASKVGDLTIAPTLGGGLSGITSFLEGISKTLDSEGIGGDLARGILKGIGGILSGPGLQFLTFTFLKLFQNLTTFAAKAVADFSGMNSKAKQLELTQVQVLMAMAEQPGIMQQVRNGTMSVEQASRQVFGNIVAQNNAMQAQLALAKLIAQAGTGAGLTVAPPKYRVTAAGHIPNFNSDFAMEEAQAKSLGARNPKARFGKGRIGGQPFIMNSEETEIPNFGKNGDSAVIPHYSKGFVPNFAKIKRSGTEIANSRSFSTLISGKFANGIDSFTANYNLLRLPYSNEDLEKEAAATKKTKGRLTEERAKTHLGKGALDLNAIDPTSPFDLKKGSSFYEVRGRKSIGATALLAKAARYKAQLGDGLKPVEFDAPPRKQEVDLGTFNVIGLSNSKVASEFLSAASGHIPNFAHYFYDSDLLAGKDKAAVRNAILANNIKKNILLGPSGSGKTYQASTSGLLPILGMEDIEKATEITLLSGSGKVSPMLEAQLAAVNRTGGSKKYLNVPDAQIKAQKQSRLTNKYPNDKRSEVQLAFSANAPLNDPEFIKQLQGLGFQNAFSAGHIPNFADLRFQKSFDKEFGITRLTGISGKEVVGDIEYSGKSTREIEAFDINEKYRGKGLAKQFYGAMGKGKTKGTLLPNYDKDGNVFFPQLSRANSAKSASVSHYDAMGVDSKITVAQFQQLIAKNKSDKSFWKNNSFDLHTSHARGHIPNFASMAAMMVPMDKKSIKAIRTQTKEGDIKGQAKKMVASKKFEDDAELFLRQTLEQYEGTKVLGNSIFTRNLSGKGTGMSGGGSFGGYDFITEIITQNPVLAEILGIKTGTVSNIATSVKGGGVEGSKEGKLETQMGTGDALLQALGFKGPIARLLAVGPGQIPKFIEKEKHLNEQTYYKDEKKRLITGIVPRTRPAAGGHIPNFANVFNPEKHTSTGGTFSQANKPTAEGLQGLLNHIGIPYSGTMTKAGLSSLFASKENKLKLYQFLLSDPIKVKDFPELHKEISDGNHRFELAKIAGIKNIPKMAGGHVPNFASQNAIDAMKRMASYTGKDPSIIAQANVAKTKLSQLTSLGDVDKLFLSKNRDSILAGMGRGAGQSSKLEALELGDLAYASAEGLPANIAEALAKIVKKTGGKAAIQSLLKGGSFANGFVPNFSALKKAVNREMSAGYSSSQIRVGTDSSLVSDSNPSGMGVYNSTEGSLGNGIGLARKAGINPKTKGMAAGHIPNFADMGTSMGLGMTQFLLALPQLQSAFEKLRGSAIATSAGLAEAKVNLTRVKTERVNARITQAPIIAAAQQRLATREAGLQVAQTAVNQAGASATPAQKAYLAQRQQRVDEARVSLSQAEQPEKDLKRQEAVLRRNIRASERPTRMQVALGQNTGYAESRAGKVQSMGMGIGMGASMAGSMAEQAVGGSTGKALGMLGESAGTAGQILATIPGPAGYVIAGFVMIKGALDALDKGMYGFAEELKKSADIKLDELQKVNNAANELAQTLNSYQTVLDNSSSTTAETATAARKYNESLAKLAAAGDKDLMTKLAGAASSKEKQAVLAEAGEKRAAETAKQNVYKSTADLAEKRSIGREQGFGSGAGKALGGAAAGAVIGSVIPGIGTAIGAGVGAIVGGLAGVTQTLMSASNARGSIFDEKNAKEGGGIGLLSSLTQGAISSGEKGSKGQQEYLTEVAAKLKLSKEEINLLKQNANLTQDFANAQEKLSLVQDSRIGGLRTEQQALERLNSSLKNSQNSLKNFAGTMSMISAQSVAGRMRLGAKASVADAQMNAARSLAPEIEGSDSRAIKEVQAAMSVLKTESSAAFKNIDADLTGGFIGELMDPLKQARSGAASAGLGSQNLNTSTAAFNNTAKAMDEVVKGFEKSGGFGKSNPQEILSGLRAAINQKAEGVDATTGTNLKAMGLNLTGEKVQELIAQKNNTLQEKTIEELQKIGQTALEQKNKLTELKNQKVLGAFGGLGSFMQDFGQGKRAETRRAISETRSGIGEVQGRGSINLMKLLGQDMQLSGSDPRMKALKEKGVQARTSDIMKSSKIYEQAGFGKLSNADARYIAEKQVTKEVDNKTIEELSAEEVEISKETNKILADLSAKTGVKVTEGNMMDSSFFSNIQKSMSSVQDSQSVDAMNSATVELSSIKTELAALTNQLTTIKATIQGEIEFTVKNTAEGKNFESIQKALEAIKEKLEGKSPKVSPPTKPPGSIPGFPGF